MAQIREIAETKMVDLNANDIDAAAKIIAGSARSMGLEGGGVGTMAKQGQAPEEGLRRLSSAAQDLPSSTSRGQG